MHSRITALVLLAGLALPAVAGCSKDEPSTDSAPTTTEAPPSGIVAASTVVPVPVTKPTSPSSVDPQTLPEPARTASQMEGLTPPEQTCIDYTIAQTLKADPSIETTEGKLQGLMGEAMVTCVGGQRAGALLIDGLFAGPDMDITLSDKDKACFGQAFAADERTTALLLGSVLSYNPALIVRYARAFEPKCAPAKLISPQFAEAAGAGS
jgi:hypothetical protein